MIVIYWIHSMNVLLFLKGVFPHTIPNTALYDLVFCTDGAYDSLQEHRIKPHVISGDLDSLRERPSDIEVIETPDQNFTDFEKALEIILKKGGTSVDVYGASGKEQDHFLGNLSVALKFEVKITITFYDDFHRYFVTSKGCSFHTRVGKIVSLYPFPSAQNITTKGLKYPLLNEPLELRKRIGTRNQAINTFVEIVFTKGTLIIFVERD
ncbi:MAG: thiamine diphosphokinase [Flavobacteriales bacterium]